MGAPYNSYFCGKRKGKKRKGKEKKRKEKKRKEKKGSTCSERGWNNETKKNKSNFNGGIAFAVK
jgi:hypothetical protein